MTEILRGAQSSGAQNSVIQISLFSYVDASVLGFLKQFQGNCLLSNVNLVIYCLFDEAHLSQGMLSKILQLFTSINSIEYHGKIQGILQQQSLPTLASARYLRTRFECLYHQHQH
jgi:hypothetical protein